MMINIENFLYLTNDSPLLSTWLVIANRVEVYHVSGGKSSRWRTFFDHYPGGGEAEAQVEVTGSSGKSQRLTVSVIPPRERAKHFPTDAL